MKKTHAVSVNYWGGQGATFGPFTSAHAEYLAALIEEGHTVTVEGVTVTRHVPGMTYTESVPPREGGLAGLHRCLDEERTALALAKMVASAEGITIEQALRDQVELFA